ncbi:hypothetical protein BDR26DRAFT_1012645 [Obelidium mucronatum]|nr:hypothetical protein BDR26DRAFT_1012645 [Obelidium mucronatum]
MFARTANTFTDYSFDQQRNLSLEELQARCDHMHDLVYPEIAATTRRYQAIMREKYNKKFNVKDELFPLNSYVMAKPDVRESKTEPRYEGPYRVIKQTRNATYQLLDADGSPLSRNYAPHQLKLISAHTTFLPTAEVSKIHAFRTSPTQEKEYLVSWKNFDDSYNEWTPQRVREALQGVPWLKKDNMKLAQSKLILRVLEIRSRQLGLEAKTPTNSLAATAWNELVIEQVTCAAKKFMALDGLREHFDAVLQNEIEAAWSLCGVLSLETKNFAKQLVLQLCADYVDEANIKVLTKEKACLKTEMSDKVFRQDRAFPASLKCNQSAA